MSGFRPMTERFAVLLQNDRQHNIIGDVGAPSVTVKVHGTLGSSGRDGQLCQALQTLQARPPM